MWVVEWCVILWISFREKGHPSKITDIKFEYSDVITSRSRLIAKSHSSFYKQLQTLNTKKYDNKFAFGSLSLFDWLGRLIFNRSDWLVLRSRDQSASRKITKKRLSQPITVEEGSQAITCPPISVEEGNQVISYQRAQKLLHRHVGVFVSSLTWFCFILPYLCSVCRGQYNHKCR